MTFYQFSIKKCHRADIARLESDLPGLVAALLARIDCQKFNEFASQLKNVLLTGYE